MIIFLAVDVRLPMRMEMFLQNIFQVTVCFGVVAIVYPVFLLGVIPLMAVFVCVHHLYHVAVREIKRVDGVTRSPVISHLTTCIQGLHSISAYNKQQQQCNKSVYFYIAINIFKGSV